MARVLPHCSFCLSFVLFLFSAAGLAQVSPQRRWLSTAPEQTIRFKSFYMSYRYSAGTEIITNNFLYNKKVQINI